jgi:hypothetical protein
MRAATTSDDARIQRYANWIGILALLTGLTTSVTVTFLASALGWHGAVARAAALAIGQLTAAVSAYPYVEHARRRSDMVPLPFRTYISRMIALALALFALMTITGIWSR